jgi:hypothetical protein
MSCWIYFLCFKEAFKALWLACYIGINTTRWAMVLTKMIKKIVHSPLLFLNIYIETWLIFEAMSEVLDTCVLLAMFGGGLLGILVTFVAIKLYTQLPIFVYLHFVVGSIGFPILICIVLPPAIAGYEESKRMLKERLSRFERNKVAPHLIKRLKACRPITIYGGLPNYRLFYFRRETFARFWAVYIDSTVTALLSVSVH